MSSNNIASRSDAGDCSGELGRFTKTDRGSTPGRGCGGGDEREGGNSRDFGTELAADGDSSQSEARREGHAERYDVALHSDGVSSPTVLGQQLAGEDLASGNVSPTFEPVLGSKVLSSQQRGVIPMTETKVESGSRSLPSQQSSSPTTKVEMKLSAPLPPESRLEGAFESSASLFEAILDSSGANKNSSGAGTRPFESPKRATGKPEGGQPGSNGDHGGHCAPTKTLKKAPGVKLELDRAAFTPLGRAGPRQRHENHLSGASLRTSWQQSGPAEGLENEWAGPTSAEQRAHFSGRAKPKAAAVTKYLSKPSQEAGSSINITSHDNRSQGTPGHGPGIKGPVATTLHEYNVHNTANDIKRYRIAGLLYPGSEYFSHAPPSGPSPTRPYHRDPGVSWVYPGEFFGHEPRPRRSTQDQLPRSPPVVDDSSPRRSTQCQSQRSRPAVRGITISEGVSVASSPENTAFKVPRPFYREAASRRHQSHGTQAVERRRQLRLSQASDHRRQPRGNQLRFGHDAHPQLSTQEVPVSPTQQQPQQQQHPQVGPTSVIQTHHNITGMCSID